MDFKELEKLSPEEMQNVLSMRTQQQVNATLAQTLPKGINLTVLSGVESTKTEWLWRPYIPLGKITLLTADPGTGKTFFCLYLAAVTSSGRTFYGNNEIITPSNVMYQTAEDGLSDTIKPRLEPMNPNFDKIFSIDETEKALSLSDERIEQVINYCRPKLVIFDPLQAYLGADVDMHRANEVRPIMSHMARIAERYNCAIVFVMHNSKMNQNQALYRTLGSIDIPAIARSMLVMANHPEEEEKKILCHEKSSLAQHGKSIIFHIDYSLGGICFDGFSDLKADDILNVKNHTRNKPSVKKDTAAEKLLNLLEENGGAVTMNKVIALQIDNGWSKATLYRAKSEIDIQSVKIGYSDKKRTWWILPDIDIEAFKRKQLEGIPEQMRFNDKNT